MERRAATLYRLAAGETSLVIAPLASALWRYREGSEYAELTRPLEKDKDVPLQDFLAHLGATGYVRAEMVELPGQFAVRGGIVDVFSPETPRPVRIELLGDTVESVREFDPRTQRSISPVNRTSRLAVNRMAGSAQRWRRFVGAANVLGAGKVSRHQKFV